MAARLRLRPLNCGKHVCAQYLSGDDPRHHPSGILWRPHDGHSTGLLHPDGDGAAAWTGSSHEPETPARSELALSAGPGETRNGHCSTSGEDERVASELSRYASAVSEAGSDEESCRVPCGSDAGRSGN